MSPLQVKQGPALQAAGTAALQEQAQGSNVLEDAQGTRISRSRMEKWAMDGGPGPRVRDGQDVLHPRAVGSHSGSEADQWQGQMDQLYKKIHSAFSVENGLSGAGTRQGDQRRREGPTACFREVAAELDKQMEWRWFPRGKLRI